jgi:hypothetical protein
LKMNFLILKGGESRSLASPNHCPFSLRKK